MPSKATQEKMDLSLKLDKLKPKIDNSTENTAACLKISTAEVEELTKSIKFMFEEMKSKLDRNDEEMGKLRAENATLTRVVHGLTQTNKENRTAIDNLDQYGRRECLEIKGLQWSEFEDTDDLVSFVASEIDVKIDKGDISVSHRLSKATAEKPKPRIFVRFCSRKTRDQLFRNRAKLHNMKNGIFIDESLSKENRVRFHKCLRFKKKNRYHSIWTRNGVTYLKKDVSSEIIAIRNDQDMLRHEIFDDDEDEDNNT